MFKDRFWLTLALSVPVVYFSPMFGHLLGYMPPEFPGSIWIPPLLGTVIFLYGGQPFLKGGLEELKSRTPGMMLLIGMAISVAFAASWVTSLGIGGFDLDFWWELALWVAIMLLGKMWQNLVWATGYNIIAVPLAAGALAFAGIVLSPAVGAVLMSASAIVVALNAQLLRGLKLNPAEVE